MTAMNATTEEPHPPTPSASELSPASSNSRRKRSSAQICPPTPASDRAENRRKAPKVSRACDWCKSKKSRCTGTLPCNVCSRRGLKCVYDAEYKRGRAPTPQPGSATPAREREESSVATRIESARPSPTPADAPTERERVNAVTVDCAPSRASPEMDVAEIGGQYFDPTSGLTFLHRAWKRLSAQNGQAIPDLSHGAETYQRMMQAGDQPFVLSGDGPLPIPERQEAKRIMEFYFDVCVVTYRLLHQQTVTSWLESVLDNIEHNVPISQGIGNAKAAVVVAIFAIVTLRQEKLSASAAGSWTLQNADRLFCASTNLTDTETGLPRLESAQARLLQVIYLLQTTRMNNAWYVFGTAGQIISALGLHRQAGRKRNGALGKNSQSQDYIKDQCRKRTFWVAYTIDGYLSVVLGRPRHYHDDDIDQAFPDLVNDADMTHAGPRHPLDSSSSSSDGEGESHEPLEDCHVEALILHAKLAQAIGQTSRLVYATTPSLPTPHPSTSSSPPTQADRLSTARHLVRTRLHAWRARLPAHLGGSTIRPGSLTPTFRRQHAALKLAYAHAVMHAYRPFLLGGAGASGRGTPGRGGGMGERTGRLGEGGSRTAEGEEEGEDDVVAESLAAARAALETVDGMARDNGGGAEGALLMHAFWWTAYVTFCALAVVYVWEIDQQRRRQRRQGASGLPTSDTFGGGGGGAGGGPRSVRKLFDLAERCHAHLARATTAVDSPNRRYSIILEELRREARCSSSSTGGMGCREDAVAHEREGRSSTSGEGYDGADAIGRSQGLCDTVDTGLGDTFLHEDEIGCFGLVGNPLDQWEATDWLDLDCSAFEPFLDFSGSPVYGL